MKNISGIWMPFRIIKNMDNMIKYINKNFLDQINSVIIIDIIEIEMMKESGKSKS